MKKCPSCAEEVQDKAKKCRYCGKKLAASWVWWIIIPSLLIAYSSSHSGDPAQQTQRDTDNGNVCLQAREYVEKTLLSPGTAKFSNCFGESQVEDLNANKFQVIGWVESENEYSARPRQTYLVKMEYKGNKLWSLTDIKFKTFGRD